MADEIEEGKVGENGQPGPAEPPEVEAEAEGPVPVEEVRRPGQPAAGRPLLKDALERIENIGKELSLALQDRFNVVQVRVNDESLRYLDMLVEADITKSRSESAAFLINEGIKANAALFDRIGQITDQIAELRAQLKEIVKTE